MGCANTRDVTTANGSTHDRDTDKDPARVVMRRADGK
ncbi:MAG: hypothetical protein QOK12_806, partial [Mycobacterium sp.]|nr:hypothetical protein [Mycobacterium sp.]